MTTLAARADRTPARRGHGVLPQQITFGVLAAVMAISALRVVTAKNVVHCALYLVLVLAGVGRALHPAGRRVPRRRPGPRVHRRHRRALPLRHHAHEGADRPEADLDNDQRPLAGRRGAGGPRSARRPARRRLRGRASCRSTRSSAPGRVGLEIFQQYVIPFEVVSVLLLAALIGAVVLAPGTGTRVYLNQFLLLSAPSCSRSASTACSPARTACSSS